MKRIILGLVLVAFVGVSTIACKGEKKQDSKEHAQVEYACPMHCEGDKTYADKNAKCPVCKMALVEVKESGEESHDH